MPYDAYNVARLHGRDFVFLTRTVRGRLRERGPRRLVLSNSYPKSGTHLLYQILCAIPGYQRWDDIISVQALCGTMNTAAHIRWKLGSAPNNSVIRCHLMYVDQIQSILDEDDVRKLFIFRDPRDVVVSHARWVMKEKRIFLHDIYRHHYKSDSERLMASIVGTPIGTPFGSNVSQPDVGADFARWRGWIDDRETLAVRFEDLVGERGSGSESVRLATIRKIFAHVDGPSLRDDELSARFASTAMDPTESHTFKKGGGGRIGGWREHFTEEHKRRFKAVAGDLLVDLGYEDGYDW